MKSKQLNDAQLASLIVDSTLPDIEYRTNAPQETVLPRVISRDGIPMVYVHRERSASHKGFVPVSEFLRRLAHREPGLMVAAYRSSNGRQTTISFNKWGRVTISPRLMVVLSQLRCSSVSDDIAPPQAAPATAPRSFRAPSPISNEAAQLKVFTYRNKQYFEFRKHCCQGSIRALSAGTFTLNDLTVVKEGAKRLRFAPLGNHPRKPRLALVGITPGGQIEQFAALLATMDVSSAAKKAAFYGRQDQIKELLCAHGLAMHMGIAMDGDLNDNPDILTTSVVKCCLMVDKGYKFGAPDIAASAAATHCATQRFVRELLSYSTLKWVIVFGKPAWSALHELRHCGVPIIDALRSAGLTVLQLPHFAQNFQQRTLFNLDTTGSEAILSEKPHFKKYSTSAFEMRSAVLDEIG